MLPPHQRTAPCWERFVLFWFRQAKLFFADAVIAVVLQHLLDQILGDIHKGMFVVDTDLADCITGDVGMKGNCANDIIRADAVQLTFV